MAAFDPQSFLAQGQPQVSPAVDPNQLQNFDPKDFLNRTGIEQNDALQDKYGGPTGAVTAFASNVVNTALPGIGPKLQEFVGVSPEEQKGLSEANPLSTFLGGGASIASGAGAAGLIGKAGKAVTGLSEGLGGLASKALGYGAEGGLFGAGQAANDAALGDPDLNAQKIAAYVGTGAALGAGFGALSEGAKIILPKAAKTLSGSIENLRNLALGTEENPSTLLKVASVPGSFLSKSTPEEWVQQARLGLLGKNINSVVKDATENLNKLWESSQSVASELGVEEDPATGFIPTADEPIKNLIRPGAPLFRTAAKEAAEETPAIGSRFTQASEDFEKHFISEGKVDPDVVKSVLSDSLNPKIETKANALNRFISESHGVAEASRNSAAYEQTGNAVADHIIQLAKEHGQLSEIASVLKKQAPKGSSVFNLAKDLSAGAVLKSIGVSNPIIGGVISTLEAANQLGKPYELGQMVANSLDKIGAIAKISENIDGKIASGAKAIFSINPSSITSPLSGLAVASNKGYDKKVDRINDLANNPNKLLDHLTDSTAAMYDVAPNVSQGLTKTMTNAVQFLKSKIPAPSQQRALDPKWEPTPAQKNKFERYYRAVNDPLSALKDVKDASLSNETMESLQMVHAQLLQQMRQKVLSNINLEKAKKLPYGNKIALSKFLGEPLDSQMLPQVIAANQLSLNAPEQSNQGGQRDGGRKQPTLGGLKQLNVAQRSATQTQDLEMGTD